MNIGVQSFISIFRCTRRSKNKQEFKFYIQQLSIQAGAEEQLNG